MIVKELMSLLAKCDPNARVYTQQWKENYVNSVAEVPNEGLVYLADDLSALKSDFDEEKRLLKEVH